MLTAGRSLFLEFKSRRSANVTFVLPENINSKVGSVVAVDNF